MTLFDLVLTVCLVADPGRCRLEHVNMDSVPTVIGCMVQAQATIAQWSEHHPTEKVVRWACKPHRQSPI